MAFIKTRCTSYPLYMSPSMTSLPLSHLESLGERMCSFQISLFIATFPSHISRLLTFRIIHQGVLNTRSHTWSCRHYHNVDFVLFNNATSYTTYLRSRIHVNTACLLDITCTLVATSVISGRVESSKILEGNRRWACLL